MLAPRRREHHAEQVIVDAGSITASSNSRIIPEAAGTADLGGWCGAMLSDKLGIPLQRERKDRYT